MTNETPSEKLARKPRPLRAAAIGAAALVVIAGAAIGVPAAVHAMTPAPKPTQSLVIAGPMECDGTVAGQGVCITAADQTTADAQVAQIEADNAAKAKAVADAAAAQAAAEQAARDAAAKKTVQAPKVVNSGKHPAGTPLPFVKSDDPQNAGGGDYIDPGVYCANGSASTVNGVPTCD